MDAVPKEAFLSYLRDDAAEVEKIAERLVKKGCTVWFDKWDMIPGDKWQDVLQAAIYACECCVVFIGAKEPVKWQEFEMQAALNRLANKDKEPDLPKEFRVIPVLLAKGIAANLKPALSESFLGLNSWIEFSHPDPEYPLHLLYSGIKRKPPGKYPPDPPPAATPEEEDPVKAAFIKARSLKNVLDDAAYNKLIDKLTDRSLDYFLQAPVHG